MKAADRIGAVRVAGLKSRWRSPIRGPWLTSVFGLVLLIGIPIEFITGLLSYAAYDPKAGNDPNHFPVNHTAAEAGIGPDRTGPAWTLELVGTDTLSLTRDELLALPQIAADLPIACTEGWSTTQRWTGVRLADLARKAGVASYGPATLEALDGSGVVLTGSQVGASESMVALKVNGADLSLDHGYPARVMIPAAPGEHNKKWMSRITFEEARSEEGP